MVKRKGRGQPKASSLLKKVKHSEKVESVILSNPSYELEVDLGFVEEQETGKHGFTLSYSAPVDLGFVEEQESGTHRFPLSYSLVYYYFFF